MTDHHHFHGFLKIVMISMLAWFLFVVSDTVTKLLTETYPVPEVILIVYAIGLAMVAPYIAVRYGVRTLVPKPIKWFLVRGMSGALGACVVVHALARIPLADFYGIIFLSPLLLCLMSHFWLKERIGVHRLSAILVGFGGVIVLAGPHFERGDLGYLFALCGAFFSALNGIAVRKIGKQKIISLYVLYPFLANVLLNIPLTLMDPDSIVPHWEDLPLFLIIPVVLLVGLLAYSYAFAHVKETAMIAPFNYSQIVWGALFGYVLFDSVPSHVTIIGTLIIIGAGLYMIWREYALHKATVIRSLQK